MTSIKDWQDSMSEVDGWAEMIDYIDEDDVKRWNADKKLDPQKFKSALDFAVKSDSMRLHLFADNYWLRAHSETLQDKAPKQKTIIADEPGTSESAALQDRPRGDFHMPLSFWCNLGGVFFKGQKKHTAEALLWTLPKKNQAILDEYGQARAFDGAARRD